LLIARELRQQLEAGKVFPSAPVVQLDRATASGAVGCGFEPRRAHSSENRLFIGKIELACSFSCLTHSDKKKRTWRYRLELRRHFHKLHHRHDDAVKSATSGASISNALAGYGTDQYVRDYENELGAPWNNSETWMRLSYPFLHADRIKTPTLFLCGQNDFNVPLLNIEQMYQALRSLGVPTELVIYPGEFHEFKKPSYIIDRYKRYLDWHAKWIKR
jgi:pimeloyl-ACP methyl ester carboxylesterase